MMARPFNAQMAAALRTRREEVAQLEEAQAKALIELGDVLKIAGLTGSENPEANTETGGERVALWVCTAALHADIIRDALAPFDSGERPAKSAT